MKISKIFHWLYAFLMSLPIVAVLTTSLYVVFNPNAMESTSITETQYRKVEYQTNEVNSVDDLVVGNVYYLSFNVTSGTELYENLCQYDVITLIPQFFNFPGTIDTTNVYLRYKVRAPSIGTGLINFYSTASLNTLYIFGGTMAYNTLVQYPFIYNGGELNITHVTIADLTQIPSQYEEIETTTLDNAFSWAVNSINDNPLFSWASASFLVQPFHYIGNVFGLPITSPINTLLSYWLDISIIWLVFDLIMYLPLLAHRWLDKGVLE